MLKEKEEVEVGKPISKSFTKACIERGLFKAIIDILGELTGESKRKQVSLVVNAEAEHDEDWEDVEELEVMQPTMEADGENKKKITVSLSV